MSDLRRMIEETAARMFVDHSTQEVRDAAEAGTWPEQLWNALSKSGLLLAGVAESSGGAGGSLSDSLSVLREAGRHAAPGPIAETLVASWMLAESGLTIPEGALSIAVDPGDHANARMVEGGWLLNGHLSNVPWPEHVAGVVVLAQDDASGIGRVCVIDGAVGIHERRRDLAGEARHDIALEDVIVAPGATANAAGSVTQESVRLLGALCRAVQMAGALERVLELTVEHANVREQFGRPIAGFQAVRQQIALLATHVAAAGRAAARACESTELPHDLLAIAIAKSRTGEAAGNAAAIAHQVHGAMGVTHEHTLHHFTRRLWTWRDDFGTERYWNTQIGRDAAARGADALWPMITSL